MSFRIALASLAALSLIAVPACADPGKDESGKRDWRKAYGWQDDGPRRGRDRAGRIPRGHLPPPGECRVWTRGVPAGHQPPPYRC